MAPDRFDRLTERQRQCLRLVRDQLSSKEIGLRLGLDAGTVDQHLKAAMRTLGVARRGLAAIALEAHERGTPPPARETLDIQSPDIAEPPPSVMLGPSTRRGGDGPALTETVLREHYPAFEHVAGHRPPFLPQESGGSRNDLSIWQTIGLSLAVTFAAMLCLGIFVESFGALGRIGVTLSHLFR